MKSYLQYLVILLDDTSVAYCHADNPLKERNLIPIDTLRKAILFGMKENLMIQYVYPDYELPAEYEEVIESIDNVKIGREVQVLTEVPKFIDKDNVVLRLTISDFISKSFDIAALLPQVKRMNICIRDVENFKDEMQEDYKRALNTLCSVLANLYKSGKQPQVNILTDRLSLTEMHNCEAGIGNITIAPNGKFYLCPAFYYDEKMGLSNRMNHKTKDSSRSVGDLNNGLNIPNKQLLQLDHAPLCHICDAYHCNRCIWLNQKLTWDNNTPSHQQCVMAHLERNACRSLQLDLIKVGNLSVEPIKEINYLDPFDVKEDF
ncbi:MAG: CXXX repeat peptide maturase [Paludibacteraceae bacterium]|nr:CXXX repeat peptide maturase [Paludibacteraceae bacterium]